MRHSLPLVVTLTLGIPLAAQAPRATPPLPTPILVKAGRLIDGRSDVPRSNVGILIEGDRIRGVGPLAQVQTQAKNARVIDLSGELKIRDWDTYPVDGRGGARRRC